MEDTLGRAGGEGRNRPAGKALAQAAELPVLGTEFVAPFGNAMRFVDREEGDGDVLERTQVKARARRSGET